MVVLVIIGNKTDEILVCINAHWQGHSLENYHIRKQGTWWTVSIRLATIQNTVAEK